MTDQAIWRRINAWRNNARCTEVLTLGRLPPQPQPTDQGPAPADDHQGPPASLQISLHPPQVAQEVLQVVPPRISPANQQRRSWPGMQLAKKC